MIYSVPDLKDLIILLLSLVNERKLHNYNGITDWKLWNIPSF